MPSPKGMPRGKGFEARNEDGKRIVDFADIREYIIHQMIVSSYIL